MHKWSNYCFLERIYKHWQNFHDFLLEFEVVLVLVQIVDSIRLKLHHDLENNYTVWKFEKFSVMWIFELPAATNSSLESLKSKSVIEWGPIFSFFLENGRLSSQTWIWPDWSPKITVSASPCMKTILEPCDKGDSSSKTWWTPLYSLVVSWLLTLGDNVKLLENDKIFRENDTFA